METVGNKTSSLVESVIYDGKVYSYCVANTRGLREKSFKFLYEIYLSNGLGLNDKNKYGLWFSINELLPQTITLLILCGEKVVGSVSIVPDTEMGLPVDKAYKKEMDEKRKDGDVLCEVFSLGMDPSIRGKRPVIGRLFNLIYLVSRYIHKSTHWIIEVVPRHESFYRHYLLFSSEGSISFHKKTGVYCKLLSHKLSQFSEVEEEMVEKTFLKYYFRDQSEEEHNAIYCLKEQVKALSKVEIYYFLDKCSDVISDLSRFEQDRFFSVLRNVFE